MPNVLDQLKERASGFVGGGSGHVLGVDISAGSIKVVELQEQNGQVILKTYGELALGPYAGSDVGLSTKLPIEKMSEALKDILREAKVSTKDAGVAIPLSASLINVIEVPAASNDQLKTIVPTEARKYIPVPISEVLLDWHIIPQEDYGNEDEKSNKTQALIVAIHKDAISQYQRVVEKCDLEVAFYEIEIFSTIRSVLDRGVKPVMIIDLGVSTTKVYIIEHGVVRGSHIINRGSQAITKNLAQSLNISVAEAENTKRQLGLDTQSEDGELVRQTASTTVDHIFAKAGQVLVDYERKYNKPIAEVVLTGGGSELRGITSVAEKSLDAEVRLANPFDKIVTPAFLSQTLQTAGPEFAVAIGAALRRLREQA